jgi:hypothetical protein
MSFIVDGNEYRSAPMNAFEQFDVARMLRNVLAGLAMVEEELNKGDDTKQPSTHAFVQLMCTMAGGLTKKESDDSIGMCLSKVERRQGQSWSLIRTGTGVMMFADIQMSQMLEIVWHVLKLNGLIAFFSVSPSSSETEAVTPTMDGHGSPINAIGSFDPQSRASAITNR